MAALSTKDKLVLKLSRERVERWNRERLKPAKNPVVKDDGTVKLVRCRDTAWGGTDWEQPETIQPDRLDSLYRATDGIRMRTVASKLGDARLGAARRGLEHSQGQGDSVQAICHDPSRDYVNAESAFAELRKREQAAMPMRVKRKLGLA